MVHDNLQLTVLQALTNLNWLRFTDKLLLVPGNLGALQQLPKLDTFLVSGYHGPSWRVLEQLTVLTGLIYFCFVERSEDKRFALRNKVGNTGIHDASLLNSAIQQTSR